jgi:8-oxo-dGTP pyrophosphatase MutT (NUDIX family)
VKVARVGGRMILVDASERVLLIHERLEDGSTHWLTPGGGVEDGEHPREAARRETVEETGLDVEPGAEEILTTRRDWSWAGVDYDQVDHFYLARVPDGLLVEPRGLTEVEQQTVLGSQWWTLADLRVSDEVMVPAEIADVLARVLADGR